MSKSDGILQTRWLHQHPGCLHKRQAHLQEKAKLKPELAWSALFTEL